MAAADGHEAEKKYRRHCGILRTANDFEVCELTAELAQADHDAVAGKPHQQVHEIA